MSDISTFKYNSFKTKKQLFLALHSTLKDMTKRSEQVYQKNNTLHIATTDYTCSLHKLFCMSGSNDRRSMDRNERQDAFAIMESGKLYVDYSSLESTAYFMGDLNAGRTKDILTYNYGTAYSVNERYMIVLALPKNIQVDGKNLPFSVPVMPFSQASSLSSKNCQYTTVYDVNRKDLFMHDVPSEFILGVVHTNLGYDGNFFTKRSVQAESEQKFLSRGNKYELWINENHISFKSQEEQTEIMKLYVDNTRKNFDVTSTKQPVEIVKDGVKNYESEHNYYKGSYSDDFDFD